MSFKDVGHRVVGVAAGLLAAGFLVSAPAAQAGICLACGSGSGGGSLPPSTPSPSPTAPEIGTATSGISGGAITAAAAWSAPTHTGTSAIEGYHVTATLMEPRFDAASQAVWWVAVGGTTATAPAAARTLSMTLPKAGTYVFSVRAINSTHAGAWSTGSNRVSGQ